MLPKEDRYYATRTELLEQLRTLLGGRVAEEVVLKEISTGAQNDLQRASALVRQMITEYGMSDALGPITFGRPQNQQVFLGRDISHDRNYGEDVASAIDKEVRVIIEEAYAKCREMLVENNDKLELIAQALLEHETLEAYQLQNIMEYGTVSGKEESKQADDSDSDGGNTPEMIQSIVAEDTSGEAIDVEPLCEETSAPIAETADREETAEVSAESQAESEEEKEKDGPKIVY